MANESIKKAFERFWTHVVTKIDQKANKDEFETSITNLNTKIGELEEQIDESNTNLSELEEQIGDISASEVAGISAELTTALRRYFTNVQILLPQIAYVTEDNVGNTVIQNAVDVVTVLDGEEVVVTLSSISATYSGGSVLVGTSVDNLTGIVVTASYSDGSTVTLTDYTLSGTIAEGSNTVTITYESMTTTITVIGYTEEEEVTLSSISATYSGGDVIVGTALTSLTGITVTGTYSDGSTSAITGYTLSGEILEGSNTITVTYNGLTTTITVVGYIDNRTLLYNWDLTESLTDTISGSAITLNGATQDSNGLTLGSSSAYASLDASIISRKEVTIEIDFGTMNRTGTAHGRLIMLSTSSGLIYRNTGSWQIYNNSWSGDTVETNANAFTNSTLIIKQTGDFTSSSSGAHYWSVEHNGNVIVEEFQVGGYSLTTLTIGQSANSYYTAVIKAIRIYEGV